MGLRTEPPWEVWRLGEARCLANCSNTLPAQSLSASPASVSHELIERVLEWRSRRHVALSANLTAGPIAAPVP